MDSNSMKKSKVVEETKVERQSELPDSVILHILSLIDTKKAIQTCLLSKRWRLLWPELPNLYLDSGSFKHYASFKKFVLHVLLSRRRSCNIRNLRFWNCSSDKNFFNRVAGYLKWSGVQEIDTNNDHLFMTCCSLSPCYVKSLRTLKIQGQNQYHSLSHYPVIASLTTLHLKGIVLSFENHSIDLFSSCVNLEELFIIKCEVANAGSAVKISGPCLVNFKMLNVTRTATWPPSNAVDLDVIISAPRLSSFSYQINEKKCISKLSVDGCPLLNSVNICISSYGTSASKKVFSSSNMKILYQKVIRKIIPYTKSLTLQIGDFKMIFMKCNDFVLFEIHGPEIKDGKLSLSWKLNRLDNAGLNSDSLEYDLDKVGLVNIFSRLGFIFCPAIFLTLRRSRHNVEHSFFDLFHKSYSDASQKKLKSSLILAELPAFQFALDNMFRQTKDEPLLATQNSQIDDSTIVPDGPDRVLVTNCNSVLSRNWQCNVTRSLHNEVLWQTQWPN